VKLPGLQRPKPRGNNKEKEKMKIEIARFSPSFLSLRIRRLGAAESYLYIYQ